MKVHILFHGALVVDVWRSPQGDVHSLGHNIDGEAVFVALRRAAALMRQQLHERGEEQTDVDAEIERIAAPGIELRQVGMLLRTVVYTMGERLCSPGADVFSFEIGDQGPVEDSN